jgi:general secretion pathway protein J
MAWDKAMRNEDGYSLIELLATLLILSSVFLLLVSGVGTARGVWSRSDRSYQDVDAVVDTQHQLRVLLEHAFPQTRYDASAPYVDFVGNSDKVSFLSPADDVQDARPLQRYELAVDPGGNLILSAADDASRKSEMRPKSILLSGVEAISISYYGRASAGAGVGWQPEWRSRPNFPGLISIHVEFSPGDRRFWPDLLVHPASTQDSNCVLDVHTGGCRGRA